MCVHAVCNVWNTHAGMCRSHAVLNVCINIILTEKKTTIIIKYNSVAAFRTQSVKYKRDKRNRSTATATAPVSWHSPKATTLAVFLDHARACVSITLFSFCGVSFCTNDCWITHNCIMFSLYHRSSTSAKRTMWEGEDEFCVLFQN